MSPPEINIDIAQRDDGWLATVTVRDDTSSTTHAVTVTTAARDRLAPGSDVETLVRTSFEFLLEREPKESILRSFDLEVIGRYFPEYPAEIRKRL
jgi:hypothetical protein